MARIFVLDTNVLLHDPTCLFRFQEHDVYLPMVTLEELDNHKTGTTDIARNARQVSRTIDRLIESGTGPIQDGVELAVLGNKEARGKLYFQDFGFNPRELPAGLPHDKADNMILAVVRALPELFPTSTSCSSVRTSTSVSKRRRWGSQPRTTSTTRPLTTPI